MRGIRLRGHSSVLSVPNPLIRAPHSLIIRHIIQGFGPLCVSTAHGPSSRVITFGLTTRFMRRDFRDGGSPSSSNQGRQGSRRSLYSQRRFRLRIKMSPRLVMVMMSETRPKSNRKSFPQVLQVKTRLLPSLIGVRLLAAASERERKISPVRDTSRNLRKILTYSLSMYLIFNIIIQYIAHSFLPQ